MMPSAIHLLLFWAFAAIGLAGLIGCSGDRGHPAEASGEGEGEAGAREVEPAKIELSSTAFDSGGPIPTRFTEDGDDVSPPLAWSGVPEGTKELVLICDDPDAPSPRNPGPDPWVHWLLYKIPADTKSLPEGVDPASRCESPNGALQGKNSWPSGQTVGYRGPAPPAGSGTHRYFFKLYALDTELPIEPEAEKQALVEAMSRHIIGRGELIGTYQR